MSMYMRTEGDSVTFVSVREAMGEANHAMMDGKSAVRTMSSGRGRHEIHYKDGRHVLLVLTDEYPAVRVTDAPGYADFDAVLLVAPAADWIQVVVVGFEWEGKREVAVVPARCVTLLAEEA